MIYDKSATAGPNLRVKKTGVVEEAEGGRAGGMKHLLFSPPPTKKQKTTLGPGAEARRSQFVVWGYFLRDEAKRGTRERDGAAPRRRGASR